MKNIAKSTSFTLSIWADAIWMASCTASSSSVLVDTALPQIAFKAVEEIEEEKDNLFIRGTYLYVWQGDVDTYDDGDDDEVDDAKVGLDCSKELLVGRWRTSAVNDESRSKHASSW